MERVYFPINEKDAAHARGMWSFTPYEPGSTTREYRAAVEIGRASCRERV